MDSAKKKFFVLAVSLALVAPMSALADQSTDVLIAELKAKIAELTAQLETLLKTQSGGQAWCHTFNANLKIGNSGDEVFALIQALQKENMISYSIAGSPPTTPQDAVFTENIASAVTGFQEKYRDEILTPNGLSHGTGYVGKSTRAKLNQLYGCGAIAPSAPRINSISPQSGPVGVKVILTGAGFTPDFVDRDSACKGITYPYPCDLVGEGTNTVHFGPATLSNIHSYDSKVLSFQVPEGYIPPCTSTGLCSRMYAPISPGIYPISITNANGTSNSVSFTVTSSSTQPSIKVLSPNGGEKWEIGKKYSIEWQIPPDLPGGTMTISLIQANTGKEKIIFSDFAIDAPQHLIVYWTIPSDIDIGSYKISITALINAPILEGEEYTISDVSDAPFSIVSGP